MIGEREYKQNKMIMGLLFFSLSNIQMKLNLDQCTLIIRKIGHKCWYSLLFFPSAVATALCYEQIEWTVSCIIYNMFVVMIMIVFRPDLHLWHLVSEKSHVMMCICVLYIMVVFLIQILYFCSLFLLQYHLSDRRHSSVVRTLEFKSEDPEFDPVAGQGVGQFLSLQVNSCADFFVSDPPSCLWHAPKFVCTLKIPYPSVVKE